MSEEENVVDEKGVIVSDSVPTDIPPWQKRLDTVSAQIDEKIVALRRRIVGARDFRAIGERVTRPVREPPFLKKYMTDVSIGSKWIAAVLLPMVIVVNLAILVVIHEIMVDMVRLQELEGPLFFIVSLLNLSFFVISAWGWFLWIRTGGFKLLEI